MFQNVVMDMHTNYNVIPVMFLMFLIERNYFSWVIASIPLNMNNFYTISMVELLVV